MLAGPPQMSTQMPIMAAQPRGPCDMGLTFFPQQGDNLPTGWSQAVQQAAGNSQPDQMMKIALAGYPIPQLYMAPVSVYTQVGGSVPVACVTGQGAAGAGVLIRPAAFTITWALAGQSGQLGPFLKGSKQDPPANVTLNFVPQLPDVSHGKGGWQLSLSQTGCSTQAVQGGGPNRHVHDVVCGVEPEGRAARLKRRRARLPLKLLGKPPSQRTRLSTVAAPPTG
jgi:hypothetical protein